MQKEYQANLSRWGKSHYVKDFDKRMKQIDVAHSQVTSPPLDTFSREVLVII